MSTFIKTNSVDKEVRCENVYNRFISDTCNFLQSCEDIGDVLNVKLPSGCYTNFRDALFHFRRLMKSSEVNEITRQAFAIEEHSNRAKTDAIICILEHCSFILQVLSHEEFGLSEMVLSRLTIVKNKVDSKGMYLRLNGIMLEQATILRITDEEFQNLIDEVLDFIDKYIGQPKFYDALKLLANK